MKRLYLFILFALLFSLPTLAQNISVIDFHLAENDLTARTHGTKMEDQNGELCAIIKVETTEKGWWAFDVGMLGVTDTKMQDSNHPAEIWVYVPHGVTWISIQHDKLGKMDKYVFPYSIDKGCTYIMKLTTAKVNIVIEEEQTEQYLIFEITPPDAVLEVNNEIWPLSPEGTAKKFVSFGKYNYSIQAQNYHPEVGSITINDPEKAQKVPITLQPAFGWIEIPETNNLKGANIYIDNAFVGKAPFKSDNLKSGQHKILITKEMYETFSDNITISDNQTLTLSPILKSNFAEVTLIVDSDAEIWINNEKKGIRQWTGPLEKGTHKVECKQVGHESRSTSIVITANMKDTTFTLNPPRPIYGSLSVESTPDFAKLFIDNSPMGETPAYIQKILIGQHELKLNKKGYEDFIETIIIKEGEKISVNAKLTKRSSQDNKLLTGDGTNDKPSVETIIKEPEPVVHSVDNAKIVNYKSAEALYIPQSTIETIPTITRSITDVIKVSPYANGISFVGNDGRLTNFTVDGTNLNNNFGLSSNLPGGGSPISVDALEEVRVVVAPFDVRQSNFVGGGINAFTKSGTNKFHGSAYTYYTNQTFRGNKLMGEDLGARPEESLWTYGITVGGPIVKDKLFFFVNAERTKQPYEVIQYRPGDADAAILDQIYDKLINDYGYNPGSYTDYPGGNNNLKLLARLDWNINDNNKLMFRFNNTNNTRWNTPNGNSCDDNFRNRAYNRSGPNAFPFSYNMYSMRNDVMSFATELNSRFSTQVSNQFVFTYTDINDQRGSNSDLFPHIDIMSGYEDMEESGNFIPFTSFGYELFSYNNGVKNNMFNATDNVTIYSGNHKITIGANWERQTASNAFMRNGTGYYRFASAEDFLTGAMPLSFALTVGNNGEMNPRGEITYNQFGVYAQDDWNFTDNFKLNFGVRADAMIFDNSQLMTNNAILEYNMGGNVVNTGQWPTNRIQVSPRVGFTWDAVEGLTIRGGSGLFQGRLPLVFFTNMPQNAGMIQSYYNRLGYSASIVDGAVVYTPETEANLQALMKPDGTYITNVNEMIAALGLNTTVTPEDGQLSGDINGVDPNFRMPQIWKSMLGIDWHIPVSFPLTLTVEGMFNKTLWGVRLVDWNLKYDMIANASYEYRFNGLDNRVNYRLLVDEEGNSNYTYGSHSAYVLTNSKEGYGYTLNAAINATPFKNFNLSAAYTYTESKEISGMSGSSASSAYTNLYSIDGPTFVGMQRSQYVIPEKVTASIGYMFPSLSDGDGVRINLFYTAYSAGAYSYIYSNDMNGDGMASDLMYIPNDVNDLLWVSEEDMNAFKTFIENDPYLSTHKGQYAEAYAGRSPWVHYLDMRVAKTFKKTFGKTTHNFEISVNFDNVLNMFNSSWGLYKYGCYGNANAVSPLKVDHIESNTPVFSMNKVNGEYPTETFTETYLNTNQCWSLLLGLKYSF